MFRFIKFNIFLVLLFPSYAFSKQNLPSNTLRSISSLETEWTSTNNKRIAISSLLNKRNFVVMAYSSCDHTCPMVIGNLIKIDKSLTESQKKEVNFIVVSFDSKNDNPAKLKDYKNKMGLGSHWKFLSGDEYNVETLAALLDIKYKKEADGVYSHENLISLVDDKRKV